MYDFAERQAWVFKLRWSETWVALPCVMKESLGQRVKLGQLGPATLPAKANLVI